MGKETSLSEERREHIDGFATKRYCYPEDKLREAVLRLKALKKPEFESTPERQCWSDGFNSCLEELDEIFGDKLT